MYDCSSGLLEAIETMSKSNRTLVYDAEVTFRQIVHVKLKVLTITNLMTLDQLSP